MQEVKCQILESCVYMHVNRSISIYTHTHTEVCVNIPM